MMNSRRMRTFVRYSLLFAAIGVLAGMAKYVGSRPVPAPAKEALVAARTAPAQPAAEPTSATQPAPQPATQDERYRALVVGTWEDDYQGKRTMTLKEDGTGTMVVELSGMTAKLFAARLQFDMVWSLEDGRLKKRTLGGQPETRVAMILKMMGDRVDEPILELTQDRLLLLDKDGETKYDWRRKKEEASIEQPASK
jgi:hypothetical protein